jgi:gliding motility-associated lipoprotein GldB
MRKLLIFLILGLITIPAYLFYQRTIKTGATSPNITGISVDLPVKRLEQELFNLSTQAEIKDFIQKNKQFAHKFLGIYTSEDKELTINKLYTLLQDTAIQELYQEVRQVFENFTPVQQQLQQALRYLRYYYPDFSVPEVVTFITGMGTDLYVDQDLIVIGLDFFLGEKARFRPIKTPNYILKTYQPDYIVPKILLLLAQQFQATTSTDRTLLNGMLAYGKACYFTKALLPNLNDHIILGYTAEQLADTQKNQRVVWEHFIEHQLLYETNYLIKKRYLSNRPFTAEIGPKCPGNIGGWLGWEIIKQYMQRNPKTSLAELMQDTDAQKLFTASKYRPA